MVAQPYLKAGKNFTFPEYKPTYPRDPAYRLIHYRLEVKLNPQERSIQGTATITLSPRSEPLRVIELDAVEMRIDGVEGEDGLEYDYDGTKLTLRPKKPVDGEFTFKVRYFTKPRVGLHFILPDDHYPNRVPTIWSQGEPEYNRYWMPVYDYPNNKCTSEMVVVVPTGFTVVSNGRLVSVREEDGSKAWHWRMDKPHSTYLISLAAGHFSELKEKVGEIELSYYVPRGREEDVPRSFSKTADMMRFFAEYTGVEYPFPRYSQVCVTEFIVGGMENTTATTLTDATLHDEHAHLDFSSDPLVAHELAHQWFGDMVTMSDWSHIWLNESFATYLENLYLRKDKGIDEFVYEMRRDLQSYLEEYDRRYSRPIVTRLYKYPEELFDMHAYPKGGLVLHTLSNIVGEQTFRRAIQLLLTRHSYGNADTEDFRKILEEVSSRSLEKFFEQLVYSAGHPVIKFSHSWDDSSKMVKLTLKQAQGEDAPEAYHLSMDVVINFDGGELRQTLTLEEREASFHIACERKPWHICVDPEFKVFKVIDAERSLEELVQSLARCSHVYCRLEAAKALGKLGGFRAVEALRQALVGDAFWGVSAEAAKALGEIRSSDSKEALIEAVGTVTHPKVRNAVAEALGAFKEDEQAISALLQILRTPSESYYVRQQAASALGRTKASSAHQPLVESLTVSSHNNVITVGALQGLAELGTDESLNIVLEHTRVGKPTNVRMSATVCLAKFPGRQVVYERLADLSRDPYDRVRQAVIQAAREMLDPKLLQTLDYMAGNDLNTRIRRGAREVARKIREQMEKGVEYKALREELEKVKEDNRRLLERLSRFEGKTL